MAPEPMVGSSPDVAAFCLSGLAPGLYRLWLS
jgi:hypothetical protein